MCKRRGVAENESNSGQDITIEEGREEWDIEQQPLRKEERGKKRTLRYLKIWVLAGDPDKQ